MNRFYVLSVVYIVCSLVTRGQLHPTDGTTPTPDSTDPELQLADLLGGLEHSGFTGNNADFHEGHNHEGAVITSDAVANNVIGDSPGATHDHIDTDLSLPSDNVVAGKDMDPHIHTDIHAEEFVSVASKSDGIITTNAGGFDATNDGFGASNTDRFGSTNDGFSATNDGFGLTNSDGFGPANDGSGTAIVDGISASMDALSSSSDGLGGTNDVFGPLNTDGFGAANDGFGAANDGFGAANDGFGAANDGFEAANDGFGAANDGFGAANDSFGAANDGFGAANSGFGAANDGFGTTNTNRLGGSSDARNIVLSDAAVSNEVRNVETSIGDGFTNDVASNIQAPVVTSMVDSETTTTTTSAPVANDDGFQSVSFIPMPKNGQLNNLRMKNIRKPLVVELRKSQRNRNTGSTGFSMSGSFNGSPRRPDSSSFRMRPRDRQMSSTVRPTSRVGFRQSASPLRQSFGSRTQSRVRGIDRGFVPRQIDSRAPFDLGLARGMPSFDRRNPREHIKPIIRDGPRGRSPLPLVAFGDRPRFTIGSMGSGAAGSSDLSTLLPGPAILPFSSERGFETLPRRSGFSTGTPSFGSGGSFGSAFPSSRVPTFGSTSTEPFSITGFTGPSIPFSPLRSDSSSGSFFGVSPFTTRRSAFGLPTSQIDSVGGGLFSLEGSMTPSSFTGPELFTSGSSGGASSPFMDGMATSSDSSRFDRGFDTLRSFSPTRPFGGSMGSPFGGSSSISFPSPSGSFGSFGRPFSGSMMGPSIPTFSSFPSTFGSRGTMLFR